MERGAEDIEEYKRSLGEMAREGVGGEAMVQIV